MDERPPRTGGPTPTEPMADQAGDAGTVRARLVEERRRLTEILGDTVVAPGPMTYGSQAAAATQVFEQQRDLALRERTERALADVDAALRRVDAGTYGACTSCGRAIDPERLDALPWAALCIDCQRAAGRSR